MRSKFLSLSSNYEIDEDDQAVVVVVVVDLGK